MNKYAKTILKNACYKIEKKYFTLITFTVVIKFKVYVKTFRFKTFKKKCTVLSYLYKRKKCELYHFSPFYLSLFLVCLDAHYDKWIPCRLF